MNITIRDIDEKVFREFKAKAIKEEKDLGSAFTNAMRIWLERKEKTKKSFLDLKPFDWGEGTEESSIEVDRILYGD
jgi:hypothetical protein